MLDHFAAPHCETTSLNWGDLAWSPWVAFEGGDFTCIWNGPGVYRVRVTGQSSLMYVGQTGRNVRQRLKALRSNTLADLMPFNDPHTAAPSLWAWRDATRCTYECSGAQASADPMLRQALECWLLWQHRLAHGSSAQCNHGQFHPLYTKSRDQRSGQRGGRILESGNPPPQATPSQRPLHRKAEPDNLDWMGLEWSAWASLNSFFKMSGAALYRLRHADNSNLLYIGETLALGDRMRSHARSFNSLGSIEASYVKAPPGLSKWGLRELENDLIGGYYDAFRAAPTFQFSNGPKAAANPS